jgi:hypothetical protein
VTVEELARQARAAERSKVMVLRKGKLGEAELDFTPVRGAAAISLATRLTIESFSMAQLESVRYSRSDMPVRFVSRTRA